MNSWLCFSVAFSIGLAPAIAAPARAKPAQAADNPAMTAMFDADQGDRAKLGKMSVNAVATRDAERRDKTTALLHSGKLRTGNDFYRAAFVFQHGLTANDYLLAHTFAVIAAARGRTDATWIAAATLDRYLQKIGQKQVYGTQYQMFKGSPLTQEPYDRSLIPDTLREALGVAPLAQQEQRRQKLQAEMDAMNKTSHPSAKR